MAYVTPPTAVSGGTATAADFNVLGADIEYLYGVVQGVGFSAVKLVKTSQSITDSAYTNISWASESYDYGGWWSSGVQATVPAGAIPAGYTSIAVVMGINLRWAANATGSRRISFKLNDVEFAAQSLSGISGDTLGMVFSDFVVVEAGDLLKVQVYQSSGGNLDLDYAYLTIVRHAPVA